MQPQQNSSPATLSTPASAGTAPSPTPSVDTHFKGWAKPGPVPPGARSGQPALEPGETLDAISGHFRLFQLSQGHRFSTDDVLTAWYGTSWCPRAERILDLGSGIGTVAHLAAWRLPGASIVTIEAQVESVRLARKSVLWNGLSARYEIREGDFRDPALLRPDETFDLILGSPPYFPPGTGVESEHPQRQACRFELRGTVADYTATAAPHLAPGGIFACVFPILPDTQEARMRSAAEAAGLVVVRRRPVVLREGEPPLLGLFAMMRRGDLPERMHARTWSEPPLIIRAADGTVHPEYAAVKLSFGFPP
jgi:tRNA1(Val) A37 N6-methylase TrmN6